jgi:hypothetical protein
MGMADQCCAELALEALAWPAKAWVAGVETLQYHDGAVWSDRLVHGDLISASEAAFDRVSPEHFAGARPAGTTRRQGSSELADHRLRW